MSSSPWEEAEIKNHHHTGLPNVERPGMMMTMPVLLYTAAWCRDCREAKRFLDKHNIPYTEIDIEMTPGAAEDVIRNVGKRAIPQFVIDGKWVQPYRPGRGFLYAEMSELFGVTI